MKSSKKRTPFVCTRWTLLAMGFSLPLTAAATGSGLVDVYQMAVMHDAQLAQQRAEYQANQEIINQAKAVLLPEVNATGSYNLDDLDDTDQRRQNLSVTLNQPLYNRAAWSGYEQAKYTLKQSEYTLKSAEQDLMVRAADAYFKVLLAQEDVNLSKAKEESDRVQWERAEASAEVGLASRTDVLQAKSSYDLSKSNRINSENALDVAYEELMKLTGRPLKKLKQLALTVGLPQETLDIETWEDRAQSGNLDVMQVETQMKVASKEIEVQKSGHWFTANLQAQYSNTDYSGYSGANASNGYDDNQNSSVGVSVTLPLYSGGGTSARVTEARYQYKAAEESLRNSREQARLNARVQVRSLERGQSYVEALREAVKSNRAFLEAAEEGYRVGLKTMLEVLTARSNLFDARRNLVDALHQQVLNRLKLEQTVGDLQPEDLADYDALLTDPA